eukprot:7853276-Pyramimonas_sp.AAC.1
MKFDRHELKNESPSCISCGKGWKMSVLQRNCISLTSSTWASAPPPFSRNAQTFWIHELMREHFLTATVDGDSSEPGKAAALAPWRATMFGYSIVDHLRMPSTSQSLHNTASSHTFHEDKIIGANLPPTSDALGTHFMKIAGLSSATLARCERKEPTVAAMAPTSAGAAG